MSETVLRQLAMLNMIPRAPRKITVKELQDRLNGKGYATTERSIQRDLNTLSQVFSLYCDNRSKPYGWQFTREAAIVDLPGMEPATALAFKLAEVFLQPLLPPTTLKELQPHMLRAEQVLAHTKAGLSAWPNKVRVLPRGQQLQAPDVDGQVVEVVYRALLEERRFNCLYHSRSSGETKQQQVSPLGLVFRNGVIYLVCTLVDYQDIRQLVLHRMEQTELTDITATAPEGFDLDTYIQSRQSFDYPAGTTIELEVLFERATAAHLYETPLSVDQRLTPADDGRVRLQATVVDTLQLRWWLLGFGAQVEVIAPRALREEFAATAKATLERYSTVLPA